MPKRKPRTEKLRLCLAPDEKRTLHEAASTAQRSLGAFVLESALSRAEETLAGLPRFGLDAAGWAAFTDALDASTAPRSGRR